MLASLALGLWRGLVGEALALLAWVLAALAAWQFGPEIGALITAIADPGLRAGRMRRFCRCAGGARAGSDWPCIGLLKVLGLTTVDRVLGVSLALRCGLLIVVIPGCRRRHDSVPKQPWWAKARLARRWKQLCWQTSRGCRRRRRKIRFR